MRHYRIEDVEVELLIGFATSVVGIIFTVWAVLGPIAGHVNAPPILRFVLGDRVSWLPSVTESGLSLFTVGFLVVLLLCVVGVALGAYLHGVHKARAGLALIWISATLLLVGVASSDLTIAVFLFVPTLMAFAAALIGSLAEIRSGTTHTGPGDPS